MRTARATTVLVTASCATLLLVALAMKIGSRPDEPAVRPAFVPPSQNELLHVPPDAPAQGEIAPALIAWEDTRSRLPTTVLYDDGRWIRATMSPATRGEALEPEHRSGRLDHEALETLRRELRDARIESVPPYVRLSASALDTNVVTLCVARDAGWICTSVDGIPARVAPSDGGIVFGPSPPDAVPPPFAAVLRALETLDSGGAIWSPRRREISVLDVTSWEDLALEGPVIPWPSHLPALSRGMQHAILTLDEAHAVDAFLDAHEESAFQLDGWQAAVGRSTPRLPAVDTIRAVQSSFRIFLGLPVGG